MTPDAIRAARSALGMSGTEFARALGVDPITVRRWEMDPARKSYRCPSGATVTAISMLVSARLSRRVSRSAIKAEKA